MSDRQQQEPLSQARWGTPELVLRHHAWTAARAPHVRVHTQRHTVSASLLLLLPCCPLRRWKEVLETCTLRRPPLRTRYENRKASEERLPTGVPRHVTPQTALGWPWEEMGGWRARRTPHTKEIARSC